MVIKDFLQIYQSDYDISDKDFDMIVCCVDIYPLNDRQQEEYFYKVMDAIYADVDILDWTDGSCEAVADWSGWIDRKKDKLTSFMKKHWERQYSDDDFTEQWIREIHLFFAGYGNEDIYERFYREVLS